MIGQPIGARLKLEPNPARRLDMIEEELRPPEPQLLDTSVLQNLDWIDRQIESAGSITWDAAAVADLTNKYGADQANDLIDLGMLYKGFEVRGGYPWLVCHDVEVEAAALRGPNAQRLGALFHFFRDHQEDWGSDVYPGTAHGLLFSSRNGRVSPLLLRGLGVRSLEEVYSPGGPLSFLPDRGDRLVAARALIANIPAVVTTDRATFWRHREALNDLGLRVVRPTELLRLYLPYWSELDAEFASRSVAK